MEVQNKKKNVTWKTPFIYPLGEEKDNLIEKKSTPNQ